MIPPYDCCAAADARHLFSGFDDRYGLPGHFTVVRCINCGHAQLLDGPSEEQLGDMYTRWYPRSRYAASSYRPFAAPGPLRSWLEGTRSAAALWVPPQSRVIEIGCGGCEMLGYLRGLGCQTVGVEVDANVAAIAAQQGFDVHIGPYRACHFPASPFDAGLLNQVLEHIVRPDVLLTELKRDIAPGGSVIVTTPNVAGAMRRLFGRRWLHWHIPYHRHYFSPGSLAALAKRAGYTVTMMRTLTPASWCQYQWCHLVPTPEPGRPHPFWNDRIPRSLGQRLFWRAMTLGLHRTYVDHLAYRMLDALGLGDNLVVILRNDG